MLVWNWYGSSSGGPPPSPRGALMLLTATPGTQILDSFPYIATGVTPLGDLGSYPAQKADNLLVQKNAPYLSLMNSTISTSAITSSPSTERDQYLAYFTAVYPEMDKTRIQQLSTEQLQGFYRSLVFYYTTIFK